MENRIYYFTGTGNSLYVARTLSSSLQFPDPTRIVRNDKGPTADESPVGVLGVVTPVYMYRLPHRVADFLSSAPAAAYCFLVAVHGGEPGGVFTEARRLRAATGRSLDAGYSVTVTGNYLPYGEALSGDDLERRLDAVDTKTAEIAEAVRSRLSHFDEESPFFARKVWPGPLYALGHRNIRRMDRQFTVDDNCNGCGTCVSVCPVENVSLEADRPLWHGRCEQCFGCINLCPQSAIQYRDKTIGLRRYRNPRVSLRDLRNGNVTGRT